MIDDSLSDVQQLTQRKTYKDAIEEGFEAVLNAQQEKQMSVQELKLKTQDTELKIKKIGECFSIDIGSEISYDLIYIDHSQAHLLMLYLKEHLK